VQAQDESFLECARTYACALQASSCAVVEAHRTKATDCNSVANQCLARHRIPGMASLDGGTMAPAPVAPPAAGPGTSVPRTPPPPAASLAGMSPACKSQFNAFLEAVDLNDSARAAAAYDVLRASCDGAMRALSQEANVALPERQMGALSNNYFRRCAQNPNDCGVAPSTPEQSARAAANAIDVGALMNFGLMAASFAVGVAGFYAPSPSGSFANNGRFSTLNQRARSTYGQGGPMYVAPRTGPSDVTGVGGRKQ
jgi:hypothetical protein